MDIIESQSLTLQR